MADAWSVEELNRPAPKPPAAWSISDLAAPKPPSPAKVTSQGKVANQSPVFAAVEDAVTGRKKFANPKQANSDFANEAKAAANVGIGTLTAPIGDVAGAVSSARHGRSAQAFYKTRQKVIDALSLPVDQQRSTIAKTLGWGSEHVDKAMDYAASKIPGGKTIKTATGPFVQAMMDFGLARGLIKGGTMAGAAAKDAISRPAPEVIEPPPGLTTDGGAKPTARRIEDVLYKNSKNGTADKLDARQYLESVPKEFSAPEFQERAYSEIERRMADPKAELSPDVQKFMDSPFGKWYGEQRQLYDKIKGHPLGDSLGPDIDQGYVHRVVKGMGGWQDAREPGAANRDPIIGRGRTLSRNAPALQSRKFFVLDKDGERQFVSDQLADQLKLQRDTLEHGQERRGDNGEPIGTAKHATTEEIEANTPYRYHKNLLVNTVDNVLRLRRVYRNLQTLEDLKGKLKTSGLMVDGKGSAPEGYKPTTLPQFMGAKLHPKIADVFDDFHGVSEREGDSLKLLERVNRLAIGSLFWQPFSHIRNVGGHWLVGRGFDWITPGGLKSLSVDGARAVKSVMTQDEHYLAMLREGAGLQYADRANANFYNVMLKKLTGEQLEDRAGYWKGVAKTLGYKGLRDLVEAEYSASSKALWAVNDMFLMQRYFELMRKGMARPAAIQQAEREIPNYRIPSEVMGSRFMSQVMRNPDLLAFGRYKYGQFRAYAETIKDLLGPGKSAAERTRALGQAMLLGLFAYGVYEYANPAVQKLTGNPGANVQAGGPWAPVQAVGEYGLGWGKEQRDWATMVGSIITPSPLFEGASEAVTGRNFFGQNIVNRESPWEDQIAQGGEWAASKVGPLELAQQATNPGGAGRAMARQIAGVKIPNPAGARGRVFAEKQDRARAKSFARRDVPAQVIREKLRKIGVIR